MSESDNSRTEDEVDELYPYVINSKVEAVRKILKKNPHCVNKLYCGETLLDYPCRYGDIKMVALLIECGIQVNNCNKAGSPPLVYAITYNNFGIFQLLCENKAKIEGIVVQNSLTMMDLTILHGRYNAAEYLYNRVTKKELKSPDEYEQMAKKYFLRYVNYPVVIEGITSGKSVVEVGDFLTRPVKTVDPDDMETCCWCCVCPWFGSQKSEKEKEKSSDVETDRKRLSHQK